MTTLSYTSKKLLAMALLQHGYKYMPTDMWKGKRAIEIMIGEQLGDGHILNTLLYKQCVCLSCHNVINFRSELPVDYVSSCGNCASTSESGDKIYHKENYLRINDFGYLHSCMQNYLSEVDLRSIQELVIESCLNKSLDK